MLNGDTLQQIARGLTGSVSSARPGQGTGVWADVTAETGETQEGSGSDNTTQMLTPQTRDNTQIRCTHGACFIRISPLSYSLLLLSSGLSFYDEHELSLFLSKALQSKPPLSTFRYRKDLFDRINWSSNKVWLVVINNSSSEQIKAMRRGEGGLSSGLPSQHVTPLSPA